MHTVGFKVDPAARDQLSCIAAATGGTYSDATDAGQLTQALQTKVDYAITGYTTAGTPVAGADQPSDQAPLLAPGQDVDTLAQGTSDSGRPDRGQRLHRRTAADQRRHLLGRSRHR